MALYDPSMPCPLCELPVGDDFSRICCFPCVGIADPRYGMLDDSCAHADCLRTWRKRDRFVEVFNEALLKCPNPGRSRLAVDAEGYVVWIDGRPATAG